MMCPCLLVVLALYGPADPEKPAGNPLVQQLIGDGVPLPAGAKLTLPEPYMADGLTAKEQAAVIAKLTDKIPLEAFLQKSDTAAIAQKVTSHEDPDHERRIQSVDVGFVAYADMKIVLKQDTLDPLLAGESKDKPMIETALSADALAKRGIKSISEAGVEEKFYPMEFTLLDTVRITGGTRTVRTRTADGVLVGTALDPHFVKDEKEFPDQWKLIDRQTGDLGPAHVYAGLAGYVKITELKEPAGALFIELHYALEEPYAWYDGKNVLRSKLPNAVQEKVRTFRRKLAKAN